MPNKCYLLSQFYNFRFDPSSDLEENLDRFTKLIEDLANCHEKLFDDQQVVALLNSLSDKYKDIRIALEYGGQDLTFEIITLALKNKDLALKIESKDSKYGEGLHIKDKWNPIKKPPTYNFNLHKKGKLFRISNSKRSIKRM
ncbi:unnamed protein product [Fraxinus pennsylvanica]|uniref:Uncharacterized protein n=1 Tax=Fraxinus pennsylvanica TaxID=56036 RepID=A0AAD2EAA1_9LAMI|nr:unnamed protein product [Fraxinus pennsylvanica]